MVNCPAFSTPFSTKKLVVWLDKGLGFQYNLLYLDKKKSKNFNMHLEEKNTMPISKKTLRQPDMLLGAVQALGGLLGCYS